MAKGIKTGGRQKGTPNKRALSDDLLAKCEARGIDVFDMLLDFTGEAPMELRLAALKELMRYLYPQKKAIEHSGEILNPYLQKPIEELEALVKAKLKKTLK